MRTLTIKRHKSFVGSLMALKVYIEDASSYDLIINNTPCRMIGKIKNGEEKTFEIDERAAKVFVIADKFSAGICNEFYNIPEGTDNVYLSGKPKYNPATGNAFRFDGVTDEEVLKNRKKGVGKGVAILIGAVILGIIIGLASSLPSLIPAKEREFSKDDITIVLNTKFREYKDDECVIYASSRDVSFYALKNSRVDLSDMDINTLEEYAEAILFASNVAKTDLTVQGDLKYVAFDAVSDDGEDTYHYFFFYETSKDFWLLEFAMMKSDASQYADDVLVWADSVTFGGSSNA